ncbi:aminotransferase class I/II-fold pyridoxal phosphate-dependent enzyme [bacterium]|nr:aminotransferase class I/II-fold pyridoxal phosphate-dependent enzyme [bacterium]
MFKKIPRFQLSLSYADFFGVLKDAICWNKDDSYFEIKEFDKLLTSYIECKTTFIVPSARLGLKLILYGLKIEPSDEVILPAWTYFAVPSMLSFCKVKPVFVDIDPKTCNIDINSIEKAITKKTKAIIATHLYGLPMDMDAICSIAKNHGLKIIEDCAQSFGATYDGKRTGSFGEASFFSLGLTKNYTVIDGGLIAFNDPECAELVSKEIQAFSPKKNIALLLKSVKGLVMKMGTSPMIFSLTAYPFLRIFSVFNKDPINLIFDEVPYQIKSTSNKSLKSNINSLQCKLGRLQLDKIDNLNMLRHTNGLKLSMLLQDQKGITIVQNPEKSYNIYLSFPIQYNDRNRMIKYLLERGIDTTNGFIRNCPSLPLFKEYYVDCPNSIRLEKEILHIPVYPSLTDEQIEHIAYSIKEFLTKAPG